LQATVARHFAPQKALQGYGNELLGRCDCLLDDVTSYHETLSALAELYCQGYELAWHNLHKSANPRRIPLPTYPFATERYWVEKSDEATHKAIVPTQKANGRSNGKTNGMTNGKANGFDALAYEKLLDQVINNTLSVADAIDKTTKLLS
jgi:acyl transferase domain-containing protein